MYELSIRINDMANTTLSKD